MQTANTNSWLNHKNKAIYHSSLPSIDATKLCLVCGDHFSKAALPSHYKACVRKYVGKPARLQPLSLDSLTSKENISSNNTYAVNPKRSDSKHDINTHHDNDHRIRAPKTRIASNRSVESEVEVKQAAKKKTVQKDNSSSEDEPIIYKQKRNQKPDQSYESDLEESTPSSSKKSLPPMNFDLDVSQPKFSAQKSIFDDDEPPAKRAPPPPKSKPPARRRVPTNASVEPKQAQVKVVPIVSQSSATFDENDEEYKPPTTLYPCHICKRSFAQTDRLEKHIIACEKSVNKPRKVFDASKARVKGTELEKYHAPGAKKDAAVESVKKKSAVRVPLKKDGGGSNPTIPQIANPDYVLCVHCDRRFNELAAERHIPICKESKLKTELRTGKKSGGVSEERQKRMSYDPRRKSQSPRK